MTATRHQPTERLEFTAPGPGGWMRLGDHFPGAVTPEYQRIYAETVPIGMADYMARYGVLAKGLDAAFVHGHPYITPVPLAGPREMKRTPPRAAVWLMARVHPAFRRRTRAAQRALDERPWRAAAARWFETEAVDWQARNRAVEAIDPAGLGTGELVTHVLDCRRHATEGYLRHFELHGDDLLPVGLLIARCAEWDVPAEVAARAMHGGRAPFASTAGGAWQLLTGYDLDALARCELGVPVGDRSEAPRADVDLASLVPRQHVDEFEQLVADARAAEALRDDNGALTGAWPMGLLRRAMLECGRRLGLSDPNLAVEANVDELVARLEGGAEPTTADFESRRDDRRRRSLLDAPDRLGPDFPIPPLAPLPRALALIGAAQLASADHMVGVGSAIGIGDAIHVGRALVVDDPGHALELIEPGDVVITTFTCPSWNPVLAHAGAIVTTTGGLLSHAAILARELAIPAVLGDATATRRLVTGMTVTVDPVAARVTVTD